MSARKLGLLGLLLAFGLVVEAAHDARAALSFGPAGCRILTGRFHGPSFAFDRPARVLSLQGLELVEVANAFGRVDVVADDASQPTLTLRSVVYRAGRDEAEAFADSIRLSLETSGSALRIATNRAALERTRDVGFETHLALRLPSRMRVRVRNAHGAVSVDGVSGADVEASFERIELRRIAGSVRVQAEHASLRVSDVDGDATLATRHGSLELLGVSGAAAVEVEHGDATLTDVGAVTLSLRHGDVQLRDVRGDATLRAEHARLRLARIGGGLDAQTSYDPIEVEDVGGDLRASTRHGRITARRVAGAVQVEATYADVVLDAVRGPAEVRVTHGGLQGSELRGGSRVIASGEDVTLRGFAGPVHVESRRGSVLLLPVGRLSHALEVSAASGDVRLAVPAGSALRLEALAARGVVEVSVSGLLVVESDAHRMLGRLGHGGPDVRLRADRGSIRVVDAVPSTDTAALRSEAPIR